MSYGLFCRQGEGGPVTIKSVIVVVDVLADTYVNEPRAKHGRDEFGF